MSYLHAADVYGQHCCKEEHLKEEVGDESHHSKETELLQRQNTSVYQSTGCFDVVTIFYNVAYRSKT